MTDHFMGSNPADDIPGPCSRNTVRVIINGIDSGCHGIPSNYQDQVDTSGKYPVLRGDAIDIMPILYGPLGEGEYYETGDLNGDGKSEVFKATTSDGSEQVLVVYGYDNEGNKTETEFNEWQYNSFIDEFEEILNSENPSSAAQDLFERYENAGIADNTFIQNSFSFTDPQQIIDRTILGDGDVGITVDVCTTPGQTDCVDPKAINDLWEDFGRHIRVIFKGLEIPGLPEWLPLPGIMRLPTIGEIWDKITGPFNDAAREQMKECMDKDDDGDGVNNTASYCMENRDIVGIITQGILDGAGDIVDATTDAMGEIVDKTLETLDCVTDPAACARTIKDTIEGVLGGADPTQPGLPPWMRAIIIGSQYGDEILKELEKIFDSDIDGDGTIGIISGQVTCWDGSAADKEEDCPPDTRVDCWDGSKAESLEKCPVDTREGATVEECSQLGRVHVPDQSNQTKGSCGACSDNVNTVPEDENDPMSPCVSPDDPNQNEGDDCVTGAPLNAEGTVGPAPDFDCIPNEGATCNDPETGKEGVIEDGQCVVKTVTPEIDCTDPRPTGTLTFALQEQQLAWDQKCRATHCESGVPISEDPDCYGPPPGQTCDNNAVNAPYCNQCENGESPDAHVDSDCNEPLKEVGTNQGDACDLAEAGYSSGGVGVIDANGDCKRVGQNCNRQFYGFGSEDNCPTGQGYNTSSGIIDSNGDCVCPAIEEPPEVDCSEITEDNYQDCNKVKCPEGSTTLYADSLDDCVAAPAPTCEENDPNSESDGQGGCQCKQDYALDNDQNSPTFGTCQPTKLPPVVTCEDPNATNYEQEGECGPCNSGFDRPAKYDVCTSIEQLCADGAEGYGTDNELCVAPPNPCDDSVYAAENPQECGYTCDDPNATVLEGGLTPGACGPCKEGYVFDGAVERCVQESVDPCDDPEYAAANPEECAPAPPPETGGGGGGGGGGGMMGSFTPFLAGISYTPQAVPEPPAPAQKDYMAELDNIIKRSLFEGMA